MITSIGFGSPVTVQAATTSQNNIVARADYLYNITWVAQSTVYGWKYNYTFYQGSTYRIPYGQPINSGAYIGYGVSIDNFISAAKTAGSVFYTSRSTYGSTSSVYYATDCSAFVSWCWGVDRKTTYSIPLVSTYIGMATASNATKLQLGDCLNSNDVGHVVLVTDLVYDSSGNLTTIEITEQTPPQLKRTTYTPAALGAKYGTYYGIYRYSGTVPAAPDGSTNDDSGSTGTTTSGSGIFETGITTKYFPACDSSATTLYNAMASIGVNLTVNMQDAIAAVNGIEDYERTAEQNTELLNKLKAGTLKNPGYTEYYDACDSSYTTFYAAMNSIGVSVDWTLHCEIAEMNGITGFEGTVEQNTTLLNLLKAGKLIKPFSQIDYGDTEDSGGTESGGTESGGTESGGTESGGTESGGTGSGDTTTGSGSNGYENGYEGGMAGSGEYVAFGVDVSEWQESYIDFDAIKEAGYDFVILRAGTSNREDYCFEEFYTQAREAGLDIGAYFYSYATDVAGAKEDVELMLGYIEGKTFEYPIYFDYENTEQLALPSSVSEEICLTFLDGMAEEGYLVGLYTSQYYSTVLPVDTICDKYEIWVAQYLGLSDGYDGTNDYEKYGQTYASVYGMFQYTCAAYVNGVGPYDADLVYKDYPSIVKTYGFNGYASTDTSDAKESLQNTVDKVMGIRHYNYAEDTILEIRAAYATAVDLLASETASEADIKETDETLTALLAQTGTNTIGENNDGVYINERNGYVHAGDSVLFTSDFNDGTGLITVDNANIQYTCNVVFAWDATRNVYVVKSVSKGTGAETPDIQLEDGEFLLASHQWETNITDGTAVEYSATNYSILENLSVGDAVRLSGVSATGTDDTIEPAAYAKFMPQDYVYITGKNSYILSGNSVIFTADYNSGLLDANSANLIYTYNVLAQWDDATSTWKVIDTFYGYPEGTTSVQLQEGQILIAAHDWETGVTNSTAVAGSAANGKAMNAAQVGQQIIFSGVTADSASSDISVAANISFVDADTSTGGDTSTDVKEAILYQTKNGTDIRLIAFVDDLDKYSSVSFTITIDGKESNSLLCTTAYNGLYAGGTFYTTEDIYNEEGYFVTYSITGYLTKYSGKEVTIAVTYVTVDGETITETRTVTIK